MVETFEGADYVVVPSGSCATMLKEYAKLFVDDPAWQERARALGGENIPN